MIIKMVGVGVGRLFVTFFDNVNADVTYVVVVKFCSLSSSSASCCFKMCPFSSIL